MANMKEITAIQTAILSHQRNFNWILAFLTALLVLIYSLEGASFFSKYSGNILFFIVIFTILTIFLLLYLIRKEFPKLLKIIKNS